MHSSGLFIFFTVISGVAGSEALQQKGSLCYPRVQADEG